MLLVAEPVLGEEEKAALADVVDCGWITMGSRVKEFEEAFARMHGVDNAIAVSSCTAALHLVIEALGIGPGDEVLVPSLTFVASANCVLYTGATPVFVDIDSTDRPLISLEDADAKCTPRTKAVIVMHYAGYLVDNSAWRNFARERNLLLIEDSAHAIGVDGSGRCGDGAAFSFYGNKNMTTAEGGVVIVPDPKVAERVRQMRGHGMTSGTFQRHSVRAPTYDVTMLGYNYRMDELRAAIGLKQLDHLASWNAKRKTLSALYRSLIAQHCPEILVPFTDQDVSSNHIMPVVLPKGADRASIAAQLWDDGFQTTIHYPPTHRLSFYRERDDSVHLPKTEDFAQRQLTLPLHPKMDEGHVEGVVTALAQTFQGAKRYETCSG